MGKSRWSKPKSQDEGVDAAAAMDFSEVKRRTYCPFTRRFKRGGVVVEQVCGEPLWTYTNRPWKFPPDRIIHKRLRGFFEYGLGDEIHEEASKTSAQANALGKIIASVRHFVGLTGTLLNGKAESVYHLLLRAQPKSLIDEGFTWDGVGRFNERYGRIETVVKETDGGAANAQSRGSSRSESSSCKPGVMPTLFGRHLMGNTIFLSIDDVSDGLPKLDDREPIAVAMDPVQEANYKEAEKAFKDVIKDMIVKGDKRLLGTMLQTLLTYPDHPFDWDWRGYYERGAQETGDEPEGDEPADPKKPKFKAPNRSTFIPVCKPKDMDKSALLPKERALIDLVREEVTTGRQVWVFVQNSGEHNVAARVKHVLERELGVRAEYLDAKKVDRQKRLKWIRERGKDCNVMISHPGVVETGVELFAKDGNHNFATLVFYQMGYKLTTLRQASRRAYRIGQRLECRVVYFYYGDTMQEQARDHMGKKLEVALAIDGKFSSEGMAAMEDDDDLEMALVKALIQKGVVKTARPSWSKATPPKRSALAGQGKLEMPATLPFTPPDLDRDELGDLAAILALAEAAEEPEAPALTVVVPDEEPGDLSRDELAELFAAMQMAS